MVNIEPPSDFSRALEEAKQAGFFQKSAALEKVSEVARQIFDIKTDNPNKQHTIEYKMIREIRDTLGSRNIFQKIFDRIFSTGAKTLESTLSQFQSRTSDEYHKFLVNASKNDLEEKYKSDLNQQVGFRIAPHMNIVKATLLGLEKGSDSSSGFRSVLDDFSQFRADYSGSFTTEEQGAYRDFMTLLTEARQTSESLDQAASLINQGYEKNGDKIIEETSRKVSDKIKNLKENEFILLPGGTKYHAVVYKIKNEGKDKYSLEVFNAGSESDMQLSFGKSQFINSRSIKLKNCNLDDISDKDFIKKMLECTCKPITSTMSGVFKLLSIFPAWKNGTLTKGDKYPHQMRGSCTFESIMAAMKGSLPKPVYHAFRLDMCIRAANSVNSVFTKNKEEMKAVAEDTVKKQTEFYNRKVAKWSSREYLFEKTAKAYIYTGTHKTKVEQHLSYIKPEENHTFFRINLP